MTINTKHLKIRIVLPSLLFSVLATVFYFLSIPKQQNEEEGFADGIESLILGSDVLKSENPQYSSVRPS